MQEPFTNQQIDDVQSFLNQLYEKATDPDEYILHRLYISEILAGACITGKLLGLPNAKEYYYEIRKYLTEEPHLSESLVREYPPEKAILKIAEQFLAAANDKTRTAAARYSYTTMLMGLSRAALYAQMEEMNPFLQAAETLRKQISHEESV